MTSTHARRYKVNKALIDSSGGFAYKDLIVTKLTAHLHLKFEHKSAHLSYSEYIDSFVQQTYPTLSDSSKVCCGSRKIFGDDV